jgi:hypothetical protein
MSIADKGMALRAGTLISRWGGPAFLLRGSALRDCTAVTLEYKPRGQGLALDDARQVLIAAPLDVPPDHEQDKFIQGDQLYGIVMPVKGPRPAGVPIYYDLTVTFERNVDVGSLA